MESWLDHFAQTNFRRSSDTAHDLKTPLNVAVLNLELLRMRVAKLTGGDDEKVNTYAKAIEQELRRMAKIFDAFFIFSTPPKDGEDVIEIDLCPRCTEAAAGAKFELTGVDGSFKIRGHDSRIRQALKMFFEGTSRVLHEDGRSASVDRKTDRFTLAVTGKPASPDFEITKVFKFYYTDALGNADLSLAAARLIAETYGGELNALEERDKVSIGLSFPGE
ncbi:MAG TPA: histidine kinase dimerization/phospho-acceptor domain-containing protein [Thermoanaerobaculia bacterium]|jgi:nitrogen fixation/metabolism regulation signal transduction histidine kinase|nr:histidine kinase dimerization/phospho-acceptor domain-containing protein [Thermoanaerobaculia bacterium]